MYARQQLNIREVANVVLAVAAFLPACRPHVRRYYSAIVHLPSDWIQSLAEGDEKKSVPLPACLRAAMTEKFAQFDEYQLAKYNPRKHRSKRRAQRPPRPQVSLCFILGHPLPLFSGEGGMKEHGEPGASYTEVSDIFIHQKAKGPKRFQ